MALGISLYLFGQWLIGYWEFGGRAFVWVAYAPLSDSILAPRRLLDPWVILLVWLFLTLVWTFVSIILLGRERAKEPNTQNEI
jgi:hypothetical protein